VNSETTMQLMLYLKNVLTYLFALFAIKKHNIFLNSEGLG